MRSFPGLPAGPAGVIRFIIQARRENVNMIFAGAEGFLKSARTRPKRRRDRGAWRAAVPLCVSTKWQSHFVEVHAPEKCFKFFTPPA